MAGSSDPPKDADSNTSASSIGKNSDETIEEEVEAQSDMRSPLENLDSLRGVLPDNKGLSNFYTGKSKSFTNLADACALPSITDLTKPVNAYDKKRKHVVATPMTSAKKTKAQGSTAMPGAPSPHVLPLLHPPSAKGSSPSTDEASEQSSIPPSSRSLSLSDLHTSTDSADSPPSSDAASPSSSGGK